MMKYIKGIILFVGVGLSVTVARAQERLGTKQGQLGVKISPSISFNRVYSNPNNVGAVSGGASLRFKPGVIYDYPFQDNYYISTGLFYSVQQASLEIKELSNSIQECYEIDWLQLPLLLKLYTGEITLDTRLYVEVGMLFQIRINEKNVEIKPGQQKPFIDSIRRWGLAGVLGIGVEYDISIPTSIFAGVSYQPGLVNVINKQEKSLCAPEVVCYSDLVSFDLGVRF